MQLDFTKPIENPTGISGWLEKKESLRKSWKNRYFYLKNGVLKFYAKGPNGATDGVTAGGEGTDWRGDIPLLNADVSIFEEVQVHLTIRGEKKGLHYMQATSHDEVSAALGCCLLLLCSSLLLNRIASFFLHHRLLDGITPSPKKSNTRTLKRFTGGRVPRRSSSGIININRNSTGVTIS
jgi:hypothetical protein